MSELEAWVDKLNVMTTEDIHAFLKSEGVIGYRGSAARCPIATFLQTQDSHIARMVVGSTAITAYCGAHSSHVMNTSESVRKFIFAFDAGVYPELDATVGLRA